MSKITGPLFKWFGSKWLSSRLYPKPEFDRITEPYAGSAGYCLRHHQKECVIWESNELLLKLWRWLITEATSQAILDIPLGLPEQSDIRVIGLSDGQALLLKHWQRTNNVGDCWTISPWGSKPGQWTANTRARVADEMHGIKHWRVAPPGREPGTYFVDPPYEFNYRYKSSAIDYAALALWVSSIATPNQIIACEAVCPKTGAVPSYLPFEYFGSRITSRRKATENHHSKELLYSVVNRGANAEQETILQGLPVPGVRGDGRGVPRVDTDVPSGSRTNPRAIRSDGKERQLRLPGLDPT